MLNNFMQITNTKQLHMLKLNNNIDLHPRTAWEHNNNQPAFYTFMIESWKAYLLTPQSVIPCNIEHHYMHACTGHSLWRIDN